MVDEVPARPIDTPTYATLPRRGAAQLVDLIVIGLGVDAYWTGSAWTQPGAATGQVGGDAGAFLSGQIIVAFLLLCGYFFLCELLFSGQSLGKRMLGICVVDGTGRTPRLGALLARNVIRAVDVLPVFYGLGFATSCLTRPRRRLGDLIAGTFVVETKDNLTTGLPVRRRDDMTVFFIAVGAFVAGLVVIGVINVLAAFGYLYWMFLTRPS
jgi:uncharacterized RDD family membrane protein YckC